jgi:hypothetical protein
LVDSSASLVTSNMTLRECNKYTYGIRYLSTRILLTRIYTNQYVLDTIIDKCHALWEGVPASASAGLT